MSITVAALIAKQKLIDDATYEILQIYQQLDNRTRVIVAAVVNQALNHSFERMAAQQDYENYLKSKDVE